MEPSGSKVVRPAPPMSALVMLLACPDRPGIVAAVTERLLQRGWNILSLEQHVEGGDSFFMRVLAESAGPAAERVHPELMALGDRMGALAHGKAHAELLRRELETVPDRTVQQLMTRLRDAESGSVQRPTAVPSVEVVPSSPS